MNMFVAVMLNRFQLLDLFFVNLVPRERPFQRLRGPA